MEYCVILNSRFCIPQLTSFLLYKVGSVRNKSHGHDNMLTITLYQQLYLISNWKSALKRKAAGKRHLLQNICHIDFEKRLLGMKYKVCKEEVLSL